MPRATTAQPARFAQQHGRRDSAQTDEACDRASDPAGAARWSTQIMRTHSGVKVTVRGRIDQRAAVLLDQLLMDLVVGQGNRVVTVDARELDAPEASAIRFAGVGRAARARGARFTVRNGGTPVEGQSL